jgi:hypothetical protein
MNENNIPYANDSTLTPQNARVKGYKYIDDIVYNINSTAMQDIIKLIQQYGYKLGVPTQKDESNSFFGLYAPIVVISS